MIDIDLASLLVSAFFLMAFIAPFAIQRIKQKQLTKKQDLSFLELAGKMNLTLTKTEKWRNHYQIGLDQAKKTLVYARFGDFPCQDIIDLKTVKSCSIDSQIRKVKLGNEQVIVTDFLALTLHFRNPEQANKNLEFFDSDQFPDMMGEKVLVQNWNQLINEELH
ncbi:hypothetical protein [Algoriphagus sp.]|uniref:hypothetical protein n=1 Tax=Algoriphagus sp. TaxID=1872435 RepID=UPI00262DB27E|nr:hypothetical protein [Algoriphagus sp.]